MAETEISIAVVRVQAELADFRKELKTMGPAAAAAGDDIAKVFSAKLRQVQRDHQKTAEVAKKSAEEAANAATAAAAKTATSWNSVARKMQSNLLISDLEQIGGMFIMVGGNVSRMASLFTSAVRPVAMVNEILGATFGAAAPAVLGIAAMPLALLGVVGALKALVGGAVEAEVTLRKFGLVTDKTASAELRAYTWATNDLSIAFAEMKLAIGEELAPALTTLLNAVAAGVRAFGDFRDTAAPLIEVLQEIGRVGMFFLTAGLSEVAIASVEAIASTNDLGDSYDDLQASIQKLHDDYMKQADVIMQVAEADRLLAEEDARLQDLADAELVAESEREAAKQKAKEAAIEAAKATAEHTAQVRKYIEAVQEQAAEDLRVSTVKVEALAAEEAAYDEAIAAIHAYVIEKKKLNEESEEDDKEMFETTASVLVGIVGEYTAAVGLLTNAIQSRINAVMSSIQSSIDTAKQRIDEWQQTIEDAYAAYQEDSTAFTKADAIAAAELANQKIAHNQRVIAAQETALAKQKEAAAAAYAVSQALAASQVIVQGAVLIMNLAASLAPLLNAAAPAVAAGLGASLMAAQLAAVYAAPAPEFPMGGMTSPDHRLIGVRGDEGVLNPRGLRGVGGEAGLDALNAGVAGLRGGSDRTVKLLERIEAHLAPKRGGGVVTAVRGRRG